MFKAHAKRLAVDRVNALKNAMVSGIWGNPNLDESEGARDQVLEEIDNSFDNVIRSINGDEVEINKDDPFFKAMKVPDLDPNISPEVIEELEKRANG